MSIIFTDLARRSESEFSVMVQRENKKSEAVFFEAPKYVTFGNDLIAHALSTLAARNYSAVHFDFPVSENCLKRITPFTLVAPTSAKDGQEETWTTF